MSIDYQTVCMDMQTKEAVVLNEDGSYTIFINSKLNYEQQVLSYYHALRHILGDDFNKEDVQEIERKAHFCQN